MKAILSWTKALVLLAVVVCVFGGTVFGQPWDGNGVEGDPYQIWDANDMQAIGADSNYWDAHFELMADIDLSSFTGTTFNIIGEVGNGFRGNFDGNGHTISNFTYSAEGGNYIGVFGYVDSTGTEIKDLGMIAPCVSAANSLFVGSLIGSLYDGRVTRCWAEGAVISGRIGSGGLIGNAWYGEISNCTVAAVVSGYIGAGGLLGANNDATVLECESASTVDAVREAGAICGDNCGVISRCSGTGSITVTERSAGGLVGSNCGEVSYCYSTSDATGGSEAGGLVGRNLGIISNCYAMGDCSGTHYVGGLVGLYWDTGTLDTNIVNSYSLGSVSASGWFGGLVGYNIDGAGSVTNSFWDIQTSGQVSSTGGTGKTTAEMQVESTFTDAGWDFNTPIWKMVCEGCDYPWLWWQQTPTILVFVDEDANGANNGTSWADAYNHLQDALAAAISGDEIWVAEGIYKPDQSSGDPNGSGSQSATFQLVDGVAIYGGFDATETGREQRDWVGNLTILSGDIGAVGVDMDNCYHVVTVDGKQNVTFDGLTITKGRTSEGGGAGMITRAWPAQCSAVIANCTFIDNRAASHGGGLSLVGNVEVVDCTFSHNVSNSYGGGLAMRGLNTYAKVTNCTFRENVAEHDDGGGICIWVYSGEVTVTNSIFVENSAEKGGAIVIDSGADIIVDGCVFERNTVRGIGMGHARGGAVKILYCCPVVSNCVFIDNSSSHYGGAISNYGVNFHGLSGSTIVNCTLVGNSGRWGGGIANLYYSNPNITNCILWDNAASISGDQIYKVTESNPVVTYSDVQGGWSGNGNIETDPCFVQAGYWDVNGIWVDGDHHLQAGSPCIDAGSNAAVPLDIADLDGDGNTTEPIPWDLDDNPRIVDGNNDGNSIVDMGAYEAVVPPMVEVPMKFTPQALNPGSKGNWVKAHFVLPEGFAIDDVDVNTPATVEPFGIESDYINVFINEDGLVEVEIAFDRVAFCGAAIDDSVTDIMVVGRLTDGQYFYGTDTIRIITGNLQYLAVLSSHWLEADCGKPDWCGGVDLDQNTVVDFVDFALFDGCCIEVIKE